MELKDIYELWDRFEQSQISRLELDFQGMHLKLDKSQKAVRSFDPSSQIMTTDADNTVGNADRNTTVIPVGETFTGQPSTGKKRADVKEIKAPLVGVFYRASAPGESPFVEPGQQVKKGDTIGIIEAMKSMNEIAAPEDGTVDEIFAEDAVLVEYNEIILTYH